MLQTLILKNFAIVENLEVDFPQGFSVLTGETGAGKSILLDALGLLLGNKADYSKIRVGCDEAILSAIFNITNIPHLQHYLTENDLLGDEDMCLLKRVINYTGKSKNYVNGQPVSLLQLKEIGWCLVDIHGQNAHHSLMSEFQQRKLLDKYAQHDHLLESISLVYDAWRNAQKHLLQAQQKQDHWQSELEILIWKNKELSELNPKKGEWTLLSTQYDAMSYRNKMMQIAQLIAEMINQDNGCQDMIASALSHLDEFSPIEARFKESAQILQSVEAELSEVSSNMRSVYSQSPVDQEELQQIEGRMMALNGMAKKYCVDVEQLPDEWKNIQTKLQQLQKNQNIEDLKTQVIILQEQYTRKAQVLSQSRQEMAEKLSQEVTEVMQTLSMGNAQFKVALREVEPSVYGNEQIVFAVATNLGSELKPLNKIASGGELSRISLALQVIISQYNQVPTLIFDEVDAGIGGRVADVVGRYLKELSVKHQILTITHLPQVAVYGDQHYVVSKMHQAQHTISQVTYLTPEFRVQEIARMLGGEQITELTLKHATELLELAR